jgi:hypothetical protein
MQFTACHFNGNMAQRKDTLVLFLLHKNSTAPNTCISLACGCSCIICMGQKRGRVGMGGAAARGGIHESVEEVLQASRSARKIKADRRS